MIKDIKKGLSKAISREVIVAVMIVPPVFSPLMHQSNISETTFKKDSALTLRFLLTILGTHPPPAESLFSSPHAKDLNQAARAVAAAAYLSASNAASGGKHSIYPDQNLFTRPPI